jgi:hypothetical protein
MQGTQRQAKVSKKYPREGVIQEQKKRNKAYQQPKFNRHYGCYRKRRWKRKERRRPWWPVALGYTDGNELSLIRPNSLLPGAEQGLRYHDQRQTPECR